MSPAKKPAKKTAKKKTPVKKSAKKTVAKKTSARKAPARKTAVRKTAAKKTTAKKTAAKRAVAKKPVAKRTGAKKAPARKPVAGKTAAKKTRTASARASSPEKGRAKKTTAKAAAGTATGPKTVVEEAPAKRPLRRGEKPVFKTPIRKLPVKKTRPPRPAKLDAATLKKIREQLQSERADLVKQQEELEEDTFQGTQSDLTGEVGLDEDFADAGTATFDRERDLSIRNNIRDLISQIDRAVGRIDDGVYGTCERCGQPIDAARLKALPHASLCLDCKRREERVR